VKDFSVFWQWVAARNAAALARREARERRMDPYERFLRATGAWFEAFNAGTLPRDSLSVGAYREGFARQASRR
jgi:hypothetical protein